jgi:A-macroglobulin TED domain/MG2 domain/Alpha-2-macroglobulin family
MSPNRMGHRSVGHRSVVLGLMGGAVLLGISGCGAPTPAVVDRSGLRGDPGGDRGAWVASKAPPESRRLKKAASGTLLHKRIRSFFEGHVGRRLYVQVDKPLYRPGETVWIKVWDLRARDLRGALKTKTKTKNLGVRYQLISPRGSVLYRKTVKVQAGMSTNDFALPASLRGGEYKVRVVTFDGLRAERAVIVRTYEAPRIKKKLEFLLKAYGPGDEVSASVSVKRPTGEPLSHHALRGVVQLDGQAVGRVSATTDGRGDATVRFVLPSKIVTGDGMMTVMVTDGGVTESVSRRIPIVLKRIRFELFPEGGSLVAGLKTRIYFAAKNTLGKPADVAGRVVDDRGHVVVRFDSEFHGMGRFELRPRRGRRYHVELTRPVGLVQRFHLPEAELTGCVLNSFDDTGGGRAALVVRVACAESRTVVVSAMLREQLLDVARVKARPGRAAVVYLRSPDRLLNRAQGVARVTVFDEELMPLAERLVYRNRHNRLRVKIAPNHRSYTPRGKVSLTATVTDGYGKPVDAELALSVVDDTVVSFADDKVGHLLSRLYLESELSQKVHEPKKYFDPKNKKAGLALDRLLGTQGYRAFAWVRILSPPLLAPKVAKRERWRNWHAFRPKYRSRPRSPRGRRSMRKGVAAAPADRRQGRRPGQWRQRRRQRPLAARGPRPRPRVHPRMRPRPAKPPRLALKAPTPAQGLREARENRPMPGADRAMAPQAIRCCGRGYGGWSRRGRGRGRHRTWRGLRGQNDGSLGRRRGWRNWARDRKVQRARRRARQPRPIQWARVRVFPTPDHRAVTPRRRTDFRDTVFWAPRVRTGSDGKATVTFKLSDAVTSFRVFAEGVGAGLGGRTEQVFKSSLPFSMSVKLPLEVSAGDELRLPLTLTNETPEALSVTIDADFGKLLTRQGPRRRRTMRLGAHQRASLYYRVKATGVMGLSRVRITARAGALSDAFTRRVRVVPLGYPREVSFGGEVLGAVSHRVDLSRAVPGSVVASVRLYPSPEATLVSGMESMLRQPSGCFEQASSANYPNVMVLGYLKQNRVKNPRVLARSSKLLEAGYRKLTSYESKDRGYEWFGGNPGHEALSAYGLLQFMDMRRVYRGVSRKVIARTAAWLRSRRDGSGGFQRNARALDTFGRASKEVTDAYITYSLIAAGQTGLTAEITKQVALAQGTQDGYLLALATNTLSKAPGRRSEARTAAARLAGLQSASGAWTQAGHSITRSTGENLHIETTALAVMALLRVGGHAGRVRKAIAWLRKSRNGSGRWRATQATVLALQAMVAYASANTRTRSAGALRVLVNRRSAAALSYAAGHRDPLVLARLGRHFRRGGNLLEVRHRAKQALPYTVAVAYRTRLPASSPRAVVGLKTSLSAAQLKMGETVRLTVTVRNRSGRGQPMTLARVGFGGGLTFQTWQLKELRKKGIIAFYETTPREVILYFRQLRPNEVKTLHLDLTTVVPGTYWSPASSAYLYYTDEHKTWAAPVRVTVTP